MENAGLCNILETCPIKSRIACTKDQSEKCGLYADKTDPKYVKTFLSKPTFMYLNKKAKVDFIKTSFGINMDESEFDYDISLERITEIILARMDIAKSRANRQSQFMNA